MYPHVATQDWVLYHHMRFFFNELLFYILKGNWSIRRYFFLVCSIMLRFNRSGKSLEDLKKEILDQLKNQDQKDQFELI